MNQRNTYNMIAWAHLKQFEVRRMIETHTTKKEQALTGKAGTLIHRLECIEEEFKILAVRLEGGKI